MSGLPVSGSGFPTTVLNGDGKVVALHMKGGPDAFIEVLEKLRKG
jgi:hypothetical protein